MYDAENAAYTDDGTNFPNLNQKADFYLDKNIKITNGMIKM